MRLIKACGHTVTCARAATPSRQEHQRASATLLDILCWGCRRAIKDWSSFMQFGLSESQHILKDNARRFFAGECSMAEVRRLMETDTAYDAVLWSKMAEQGFTGIIF